jgi:5'-nucleotidase
VAAACNASTGTKTNEEAAVSRPRAVAVQILAINDFHGNLEPPVGSNGIVMGLSRDPLAVMGVDSGVVIDTDAGLARIPTGGVAYLAAHVKRLRQANPNTVLVSAGDLTGASPFLSSLFRDEPSVLAMNALGLDYEAVGNHDFDRGLEELFRLKRGGCSLGDCSNGRTYRGAEFEYLAANVTSEATNMTIFPPYGIKEFQGVKVAFVGMTLEATPAVSAAKAVEGLSFANEVATVNALVPELRRQGAAAIVVVVHQGGMQAGAGLYDSCDGLSGDLMPIVRKNPDAGVPTLDPAVDVVLSAHTHKAYNCIVDDRIVTSAGSAGRLVTQVELTIDPVARRVTAKQAHNVPVTRDIAPDSELAGLVAEYQTLSGPLANRVVGYIASDLVRAPSATCESALGQVIADSWLAATRGPEQGAAVIALAGSAGGVRADIVATGPNKPDHAVTYADAFAVQPFGNRLVTVSLTGDQLRQLLESQIAGPATTVNNVSKGFSYAYSWDANGNKLKVIAGSMTLDGVPITPAASYRVTVSDYAADRPPLAPASDSLIGILDVDAFTAHLDANSSPTQPLTPPAGNRITGAGCSH